MAFFSASDLVNLDRVLIRVPPGHRAAGCAGGVVESTVRSEMTAVERARAKIAAKAGAKKEEVKVDQNAKFSSAEDVLAAEIWHQNLILDKAALQKKPGAQQGHQRTDLRAPVQGQAPARGQLPGSASQGSGGRHPFRAEAPTRRHYSRGCEAGLDDVRYDNEVLNQVRTDKYARTSRAPRSARWKWWTNRCRARKWDPYKITPRKLEMAAGLLQKGGYRSAKAYLAVIKGHFVLKGGKWTHQLDHVMRGLVRAVERGLGPAKKTAPLPLEALYALPADQVEQRRTATWPAAGLDAAGISCAWLLRELESSAAKLSDITIHESLDGLSCGWAEWVLPATKTDPKAEGVTRSLACACPSPLCPVNAARKVATAAELIWLSIPGVKPAEAMPLLCKVDGSAVTKQEVVHFYCDLVDLAGLADLRITGHSARVTGAMRMAFAGHQIWTIQVFGRWGSPAILGYVREAILGKSGGQIAQKTEGADDPELGWKQVQKIVNDTAVNGGHQSKPEKAVSQAVAKVAFEQFRLMPERIGRHTGRAAVEEQAAIIIEGVRDYATSQLRLGRARVLQSRRGILHVDYQSGSALCGWKWANSGAVVMKRCGPVVGEAAGWCPRCHTWAIAIAGGD